MSGPSPATSALDEAVLAPRIASLIAARQADAHSVTVHGLKALSGGNARRAWAFDAAWVDATGRQERSCVLLGRVEAGQLEVDARREFDTLSALDGHGLAVPRALWLDEDGALLGMPGFVMERGEGRSGVVDLLKPDSTVSATLARQLIELAAAIHRLDWRTLRPVPAASADPGEATRRILDQWEGQFLRQRLEPLPALASVFGWLRRNLQAPDRLSVVHGDLRFGNFLHQGGRLTLLLDWELAHVGDPLEDLAWCYRALWSPAHFLPLERAVELYGQALGTPVDARRLAWWRIFGEAKFAVISLTAARSFVEGRTQNLRLSGRASKVNECLRLCLRWIDELEAAR